MQSRLLRSVALAAVVIISLAGCSSSGGGSQSDPASAVKSAIDAAQSGGIAKLADYACAAKKSDITGLFGGGSSGLGTLGITADEISGAMKMEFKDIQTSEKSKSGDNAVVHITGNMTIILDPAKTRDLMKKAMAAASQAVDDAQLDALMASMAGSMTTTQALDEDVAVVQENGKWVLC